MNTRFLPHSFAVLALGGSLACGTNSDGGSGTGLGAAGGKGGASSSGASNVGATQNGGGRSNEGGEQQGGPDDAGGSGPGGNDAGGAHAGDDGGMTAVGGSRPTPVTFPLLVATTKDKVMVWQNADTVKDADAPSFELSLGDDNMLSGTVATAERLAIVSAKGIFLFDNLGALSASSKPSAVIPASVFPEELGGASHQSVDTDGDLWLTYGPGRIALLKNFNSLTESSKPAAYFTHPWEQIASAAYYAPKDILFAPQVSGAGMLIYSNAKTKTGVTTSDGTLDSFSGWHAAVLGDSLVASWHDKLAIWHGLDASVGPRAPDATSKDSGVHLDVAADALAVEDYDRVLYYAAASSLKSDAEPETLTLPQGLNCIDLSNDARTLVSAGTSNVYVVKHDASGLKLHAELPLGAEATDVTLVE